MKVTFTKKHSRGYSVTVEPPGAPTMTMDPAPGYDDRLPHDAAHLIVEDELKIRGGVIGLLASAGSEGQTSRDNRKAKKSRERFAKENRDDLLFSEHAVYAAQSRWEKHEHLPDTKIPPETISKICEKFEEFAQRWTKLPVGGSITIAWGVDRAAGRKSLK